MIHKVHSKHSNLDNLAAERNGRKVLALRNVRWRFAVNNLNKKHFRPWLDTPLFSFSVRICFPIVVYFIRLVLQINIYFDNVAECERGVSRCFYIYNIILVIARKRHCSSPLMRLMVRGFDLLSEFFQGYIYPRTLFVSIDWNEEREFEWIIIVSHQMEKGAFWVRSVKFQCQCDDSSLCRKVLGNNLGRFLFGQGTSD